LLITDEKANFVIADIEGQFPDHRVLSHNISITDGVVRNASYTYSDSETSTVVEYSIGLGDDPSSKIQPSNLKAYLDGLFPEL
jgi:hypothetical protein